MIFVVTLQDQIKSNFSVMMDVIKEILSSEAGSFSFVLGLLILAGWMVYYVTKFTTKISMKSEIFSERMDKTESNVASIRLDIARHETFNDRIGKTESNIDQIKTGIAEIKGSIHFISETINKNEPVSKRKSPVSLSDLGEQIASDYNIATIVDRNWHTISSAIKGLGTKNPYDIQEFSRDTAFSDSIRSKSATFFTESDIDRLRVIAYKSGENIYSISFIAGILIRDRYFAENGIDVDEVDEYHQTIENAENIS